jgi:hypothetical protein
LTLCETITKPLIRKVEEEGKNLDEIADEICPNIEFGREKIIRIIKYFLGQEYLIQHAETLKYDVGKAQLAKKRKHQSHENIDATTDAVIESNSVTPIASCQTPVQTVNSEHEDEAGQTKGGQVLDVHDKPATCCHRRVVRKVITESENITEEESGETKGQEQVMEELDIAPVVNVSDELVMEIKRLIEKFSLEEVTKALEVAERDI